MEYVQNKGISNDALKRTNNKGDNTNIQAIASRTEGAALDGSFSKIRCW